MRYLIELGRDPALSTAELYAYLESHTIPHNVLIEGRDLIILDSPAELGTSIDDLGGIIRIARVLCTVQRLDELEHAFHGYEFYNGTKNKITYAITNYHSTYASFFTDLLKDYFKTIKVRAIQRKNLSPTQLHKRNDHLDFILYKNMVAQTVATTNPHALKVRDLGRPSVDHMKVISLRLAKILINLSHAQKGETLLDPFCGSGTILQEALLKGINAIGCDNDTPAIQQAKKNLAWLTKAYATKAHATLHQTNATKLARVLHPESVDAVVTEPYLGPYLKRLPTMMEAKDTIMELTPLYTQLFQELARILKPGKRIVIILPLFQTLEGRTLRMHTPTLITGQPFTITTSIPYMTSTSKIGRTIVVLEKIS